MILLCIDFNNAYVSGIISGIFSGFIVSFICHIIAHNRERKIQYYDDVQNYCHYISNIIMQIDNICLTRKNKMLIKAINDRPVTKSFEKISDKKINKNLKSVHNILEKINKQKYDKVQLQKYRKKLEKIELMLIDSKE